jgi:nucleotide-binding universal stress UspA family protein
MTKLLIAYDGSNCADAALDDLQLAGLPRKDVEALIMSVTEVWVPSPSTFSSPEEMEQTEVPIEVQKVLARHARIVDETRAMAERARDRVRANFPEWKVDVEVVSGSPAWEIISKADGWHPHLIIVGSQGQSALGRLVLGSVSQKVLNESRCSVRVARGRIDVERSAGRVAVAVDGSPGSALAVQAISAREWPAGSEALAIMVEDPLVPSSIGRLIPQVSKWIESGNKEDDEWVQRTLKSAVDQLSSAGLKATSSVHSGDAKQVLVEESEKWGADSIFLGSTGFSSKFSRFLLGSVSAAVAARAHCSVEVVRSRKADGA